MQCFGFWTWYLSHFLLKGYFMQCWWECKYTQTSWEGNLALYIRTKSNNSSNSKACVDYFHFIGIYSMRINTQAYEGLCARLFMTVLHIFQTCVISAIKKKIFPREQGQSKYQGEQLQSKQKWGFEGQWLLISLPECGRLQGICYTRSFQEVPYNCSISTR